MGLAVSIGSLACAVDQDAEGAESLREGFRHVNRVLIANGLPSHIEPEAMPDLADRSKLSSMPYAWLHYLRRAVAFARQAPGAFCPVREDENPAADERIDEELSVFMNSHLICHSDCEGFYVPIDFPGPLYDVRNDGLPGGILGSSQRALQEVVQAAPLLSISLNDTNVSDATARGIADEAEGSHPYWIERKVWLCMFERLRHSIEYRCAVVFG